MSALGNLASKGHIQMLGEIEHLMDLISQGQQVNSWDFGSEIFPWMNSIDDNSGYFLDNAGYV